MSKNKPYTTGEKRVFNALARAFVAADIQAKVIKPHYEESTGKPYPKKDTYLDLFLSKDPEAKRAWAKVQREIKKLYKVYSAEIAKEKANG